MADGTPRCGRDETPMRTLIADDHGLVREGLKFVLDKLGPDVTVVECDDFPQAVEQAAEGGKVDLAILDLRMPGMNGTSGVENFCSLFPDTPLIVLSGRYRRQDVWEALRCGAAGFIPKNLGNEAVLNALRLVLAGEKFIPSDILSPGGGESLGAFGPLRAAEGKSQLHLTGRERQVLSELTKGLPNKKIAANLGIEEVTVKLHLRNIYRKLGATSRTHALKIALELGLDD